MQPLNLLIHQFPVDFRHGAFYVVDDFADLAQEKRPRIALAVVDEGLLARLANVVDNQARQFPIQPYDADLDVFWMREWPETCAGKAECH